MPSSGSSKEANLASLQSISATTPATMIWRDDNILFLKQQPLREANISLDHVDHRTDVEDDVNSGKRKITEQNILKIMSPLSLSLRLSGMFYVNETTWHPSKPYSRLLLAILWLDLLRTASTFKEDNQFGIILFSKITFVNWKLVCVVSATVCHHACTTKWLHRFLEEWANLTSESATPACKKYLRRSTVLHTVIPWFVIMCDFVSYIYLSYTTDIDVASLAPFSPTWQHIRVVRVINLVIMLFWNMAYIFPLVLYHSMCCLLAWLYIRQNHEFCALGNSTEALKSLETYRQKHQQICGLTKILNDIFHVMIAFHLVGSVINLCLMIYILLRNENESAIIVGTIFWIIITTISFITISLGASVVNITVSILCNMHHIVLS